MQRSLSFIIPLLIALLTVALWGWMNRPAAEPPWPVKIQGFSFSPLHQEHDPTEQRWPTPAQISGDLALLKGKTHAVRTYTLEGPMEQIPALARPHGVNVALGAWIGNDPEANAAELARLTRILRQWNNNIVRVFVGNEAILREDVEVSELIAEINRIRRITDIPVGTAEPWHVWLTNPELAENVDFIAVHLLPYWEKLPIDQAVDYAFNRLYEVREAFPDKQIIVGEVGWPSNGRRFGGAEASLANETRFLRRFLARAEQEGLVYYVMEAFDQPWKTRTEGAVGAYWGVYNVNREAKFEFTRPVVSIPNWHELAALSVGMAVLLLLLLYRDSASLSSSGKGFLALVTYAVSTAAVWLVYDYTRQYMTPATALVGILLLVGGAGVLLLLSAEAHEWAEALWLRRWRRAFPRRQVPDEWLPLVSVHVPAYNEPPELLIATLDALAALDYPRYEVVVIDNNTRDPAVWEPVRAHCARLNARLLAARATAREQGRPLRHGRFRFFHVAPLAGFKAGALNFALRRTDPAAGVVAVIDADYIVERNWLRDLVPAFSDDEIAIVQAPQDYRDGAQNAFKAMCLAEYRGFFHIGMVTRNERNAIIQHGTMTMMRRDRLDEVGGWAEWCITEDAELGLRLFERGYKAQYIPVTYGRGLMPDTFADFKKQRYRWAYGSVRILLAHRRALLGLRPSGLTSGQRWHFMAGWLPWFADGLNLLFNFAALTWTVLMVLYPLHITPPYMTIALVPLVVFGFKMIKSFWLYRRRVAATFRQSIAAGLAGLALSHTIARAMLAGLVSGKLGFFRTPKLATAPTLVRVIGDAREEFLFLIALWLGAFAIMQRADADMLDVKVWMAVLLVQSLPYLAALLVSLASALPRLPASLIGPLGHMPDHGLPSTGMAASMATGMAPGQERGPDHNEAVKAPTGAPLAAQQPAHPHGREG